MTNLKRARQQMSALKNQDLVDSSLDEHFKELNCSEWTSLKKDAYAAIYPILRESTAEEKAIEYKEYVDELRDGEDQISATDYIYNEMPIEYTYCEWIEPIKEVGHINNDGTYIVDVIAIDGYFAPDVCTPTYNQWLNGDVCPKYDTTADIADFKITDADYKAYSKNLVGITLSRLIVTISTGKRFYADPTSRADLADVISILIENGIVEYLWKTADGIILVTIAELREARMMGLQAKGDSVGVN